MINTTGSNLMIVLTPKKFSDHNLFENLLWGTLLPIHFTLGIIYLIRDLDRSRSGLYDAQVESQ